MVTIMLNSGYRTKKGTLMRHACERFKLHTFSSFEEIRQIACYRELLINSYVIFDTNEEFEKAENDNFRLL